MRGYHVAIVGATGAVGTELLRLLESRHFPVRQLTLFASERSAGKTLPFMGELLPVQRLSPEWFRGVEIAFFAAGAARSREYAPDAVRAGAIVVDNSSAFRLEPDVPLVIPEINPEALAQHRGIIANPNCSTIIMLMALEPLRRLTPIRRIIVSTYQSASGAGAQAMAELLESTRAFLQGEP